MIKKTLLIIAIILAANSLKSQVYYDFPIEKTQEVIVDSIVWKIVEVDSLNLGKEGCDHAWSYSDEWRAGGNMGCLAMHYGSHCSYDDRMRDRICSQCFRKETQREFWYEHTKKHIETDYEKLEKKLIKSTGDTLIFNLPVKFQKRQ